MPFSARVRALQKKIAAIRDIALYDWQVIILANVKHVNDEQLRRLLDNMDYEVFDFNKTYEKLVFPLATGTYFSPNEITITINLGRKAHPQLSQDVSTSLGACSIRMIYVPIIEVARVAARFKNALLRYNPRNYLSLQKNTVNKSIKDTVLNTEHNEFSLRNNGITVLAEFSSVTDRTGKSGEGQLIIKDPQIINGGQTATTLAMIHEDKGQGKAVFGSKEVLLKIIEKPSGCSNESLLEFIESISDATNKQSRIVEADRRANDPKLIQLQKHFYDEYGLFLERKRGEFQYGLDAKSITKKEVIDRVALLRAITAFEGSPSVARSSEDKMFEEERFEQMMKDFDASKVTRALFTLKRIEDVNKARSKAGQATVTYGKYALLYATARTGNSPANIARSVQEQAASNVDHVLMKWSKFERRVAALKSNVRYVRDGGFNFDGYYKGATVTMDIEKFDWT